MGRQFTAVFVLDAEEQVDIFIGPADRITYCRGGHIL